MINKDLYIELLEDKVRDQDLSIDAWRVTQKVFRKEFETNLIEANDDFFNLGDACRADLHDLASRQLENLESDRKFDELVEKFSCDAVKEVQNLDELLSKVVDSYRDGEEQFFGKLNELKQDNVKLQNELGSSKAKADKENELNESIIADIKVMNHELKAKLKDYREPVTKATIITPHLHKEADEVQAPWNDDDPYAVITSFLKDKKYRVSLSGTGIIAKKQGCTAVEVYKSSTPGELQFVVDKNPTRDITKALEHSMSKSYKKEA